MANTALGMVEPNQSSYGQTLPTSNFRGFLKAQRQRMDIFALTKLIQTMLHCILWRW